MNECVIAKYIRLSQDDTVSESLSIPHQRLLLDCHIEDMNMPGAQILEFIDNGFTGTNVERPAFQEMIELVRCGRINCIIVKDFSRFARNALESGYYIEKVFPLYRVRFIAVSDRFDSNDYKDGTGGIDVAFKFMMNEYYSADLSKKIKSAKRVLMQNGEHIVGGAIYGYRKNDKGRWEHDPLAAEVVREIYDMALNGKTTAQIRNKLFADRRLAPMEYDYHKKGKDIIPEFNWTTRQIYRILTNEQYTGSYVAGKRETSRVGSIAMIEKPRSEWIIIPDSHPSIVSKEEFERVQEILANPKAFIAEKPVPSNHANKLRERIVNGERKSCAVPYGYTVNNGIWEINSKTAEVICMIFNMTLNGSSLRDICNKLRELGIPTLNEERKLTKGANIIPTCHWKTQALKDILKDEQYIGSYVGGKSFQDENGKFYLRPRSEWIIIADKHLPIISKDVFEEVQKIRSQSRKNTKKRDYLLYGKVVCGCRGYALSYGDATNPPVYRCAHTHANPAAKCYKMKCRSDELENAVMDIIKKQAEVVLNCVDLSGFRKTAVNNSQLDGSVVQLNSVEIKKQISLLSKQRQECYEKFICLEIDRDTFHSLKDDYTKQIEQLTQQLAVFQQSARKKEADNKTAVLAKNALSETAEPKDIVDALIEKVLVFPNNHIEIHWKFENFTKTEAV